MTRPPSIRMFIVGVVVPLLAALAGIVAVLVALPDLPDPIAVHWGPSGQPDGFGSPWLHVLLLVVVVVAYSAFSYAVTRPRAGDDGVGVNQKLLIAIGPFLAVLLAVIVGGSVLMQRGLDDAADAGSIVPVMIAAFAGGIAAGVVGWFVLPKAQPLQRIDMADAPVLDLASTQRAVWIRRIGPSPWVGAVLLVVGGLMIIGGGIVMFIVAPGGVFAFYIGILLLAAVSTAATLFWRVQVSDSGFVAVSALGFPRFAYALSDISVATALEVDPARQFGGWGLRWAGPGRFGIVTRAGEGIEVERVGGKTVTVTVDGAEQGAALLNALVARERSRATQ